MNRIVEILAIGLILGTVICIARNKKKDVSHSHSENDLLHQAPAQTDVVQTRSIRDEQDEQFRSFKGATIETMANRHEEAAHEMKDTVAVIQRRSAVSDDELKDLNHLSDELDILLGDDE